MKAWKRSSIDHYSVETFTTTYTYSGDERNNLVRYPISRFIPYVFDIYKSNVFVRLKFLRSTKVQMTEEYSTGARDISWKSTLEPKIIHDKTLNTLLLV